MPEYTERLNLVALTAGLEDFDRRISETRQRSQALEAKTAAFHLGHAGAGARRSTNSRLGTERRPVTA